MFIFFSYLFFFIQKPISSTPIVQNYFSQSITNLEIPNIFHKPIKIETNLPLQPKQTETESQPSTCTPLPFHHSSSPINLFLLLLHSPLSPSKQKKNGGLTETGR
ncbi:hypothetical protein OIU84_027448 [Salix udensis]|uniref:Uncharacterized protein n=1 Tax=Salix udensis TaxID=889485 RepID=A0AAD6P9T4_9ROSI|nr:hypothetical protein OIU84_027448 [Salix udensis]KAJ6422488.1 hypothetical protein OIU84_027448 [Salix udensis]